MATGNEWELTITAGNMGGAPPHRTWHVSDTWTVKVQDDMTVAQLLELLKGVTHRQDLNVQSLNLRNETGAWHPDAANSAQTVKDAGLTQGSMLGIWNGRMD